MLFYVKFRHKLWPIFWERQIQVYDPLVHLVFVSSIGEVNYPIFIFLVVKTRDKIIWPVSHSFAPTELHRLLRFRRYLLLYVILCHIFDKDLILLGITVVIATVIIMTRDQSWHTSWGSHVALVIAIGFTVRFTITFLESIRPNGIANIPPCSPHSCGLGEHSCGLLKTSISHRGSC